MAWNEPGGSKDDDPWGGRKNTTQGPPDLDEVVRKLQEKMGGIFGGKKGGGGAGAGGPGKSSGIAIVILVLAAWLVYDSVYIIQPADRGVVLRFGQYVATLQPGPNIRFPRPVEYVQRVNVDQIQSVEIGFRSGGPGQQTRSVTRESLMLTQDENIVDIEFAIQYRVKDAKDYLFNVRDPDVTLQQATESAVRESIGKSKMDFVLTEGRSEIVTRSEQLIQEILDRYKSGLLITKVNMQDAQPPEQVQDAFSDAVKAREDEVRLKNEAEAYANDIIPKARGAAARMMEESNAYKSRVIAMAEGEASRFLQVLKEYEKAPEVTRERLYLDTIEEVMGNTSKVMLDVKDSGNVMFLPLDRLMRQGSSFPSSMSKDSMSSGGATSSSGTTQNSRQAILDELDQRSRAALRSREVR